MNKQSTKEKESEAMPEVARTRQAMNRGDDKAQMEKQKAAVERHEAQVKEREDADAKVLVSNVPPSPGFVGEAKTTAEAEADRRSGEAARALEADAKAEGTPHEDNKAEGKIDKAAAARAAAEKPSSAKDIKSTLETPTPAQKLEAKEHDKEHGKKH